MKKDTHMYMTLVHSWKRVPFFYNTKIYSPVIQSVVNCIFRAEQKTASLCRDSYLKTTQQNLLYSGLSAPQTLVIKKTENTKQKKEFHPVLTMLAVVCINAAKPPIFMPGII